MSRAAAMVFAACVAASGLDAQPTLALRGVAYDSVGNRPLAGAHVTLNGIRSVFADERGAFRFDDVAPGSLMLEMTHAVLDSMGLPGVAARVRFDDARTPVRIAVPSFATLWRAACGDRPAPADSALVYGTIRSGRDGEAVPSAALELSWSDLTVESARRVTGTLFRSATESDANGEYSVCGVPRDVGMRVQAKQGDLASALIDVQPTTLRVIRRDLLLGPVDTAGATLRGRIVGRVTHADGKPFEGATIVLDDAPGPRSDAEGRFTIPLVIAGTHQVEVTGIGAKPQLFVVDVIAGAEVAVAATLDRVPTLEAVKVVASQWQLRLIESIEDRKRMGFAKIIDSTEAAKRAVMGLVVANVAGVWVRSGGPNSQAYQIKMRGPGGGECEPTYVVDGMRSEREIFLSLGTHEVGVTEVYTRAGSIPTEFQHAIRPQSPPCGLIALWTKRYMP